MPVPNPNCLLLIFVEGTLLRPASWIHFFSLSKYIPTVGSVEKIRQWRSQGAEIAFLTARRKDHSVRTLKRSLTDYGFVEFDLYYRSKREAYKDVVARIRPTLLLEDNCKSIGGAWQMCITHLDEPLKSQVISIVVKEFGGLNHLPDRLDDLLKL